MNRSRTKATIRRLRGPLRPGPVVAIVVTVALTVVVVYALGVVVAARRASSLERRLQAVAETARSLALARVAEADRRVSELAASSRVQQAFARGDAAALRRLRDGRPDLAFVLGSRTIGIRPRGASIPSVVDVYGNGRRLGAVVVSSSLGRGFLEQARERAALRPQDPLLIVRDGHVAAGRWTGTSMPAASGPFGIRRAGTRYRGVAQPLGDRASGMSVAALAPAPPNPVGVAQAGEAAVVALALIVAAASLYPRRDRGRWPWVERRRQLPPEAVRTARSAIALVGDTLAATHRPEALLPVILTAAIEATGAAGGRILEGDRIVSSHGEVARDDSSFVADLGSAGTGHVRLVLFPPLGGFPPEAREVAGWFAEQATIALENASLHDLVQRQAVTDEMTGLANRRGFMAALARETSRTERLGTPLVLILADIDDFKQVNDRYGHHVGDLVLARFGRVLRSAVRDVDVPVRLGGEEFGVLLADTALAGGVELAERLRAAAAASVVRGPDYEVRVTASFGVAQFMPGTSPEQLLVDADACLYRAKAEGKNRVVREPLVPPRHASGGTAS